MNKSFYIHTFGCQMNEYDTERLTQALLSLGWHQANDIETANVLIANTCTVRKLAEDKAFSLMGKWVKMKKARPEIILGMIGCLAQQLGKGIFKRVPEIDFIAGPRSYLNIPDLIEKAASEHHVYALGVTDFGQGSQLVQTRSNVSALVAVMEGCNQCCTYCAVPEARGSEKSRPPNEIIHEIQRLIQAGAREIVLLGQNITRYGIDLKTRLRLSNLLKQVAQTPGLLRLRFLTGHPKAFDAELIDTLASIPIISTALHLPLQAGSDHILKLMKRGYTAAEYVALVELIRKKVPGLLLTSDLIVGFPGETEQDFEETLKIVEQCKIDMAYCFKFSARKNTPAFSLPKQIDISVKEERLAKILALVEARSAERNLKSIGNTEKVLIERQDIKKDNYLIGRTKSYLLTKIEGKPELISREVDVRITGAGKWSLWGELI